MTSAFRAFLSVVAIALVGFGTLVAQPALAAGPAVCCTAAAD